MHFIYYGTMLYQEVYYRGVAFAYSIMMYIGYYLFVVGEVTPKTEIEIFMAIIILITSAVLNGIIIGNMAMYMQEINKENQEFQNSMDVVNGAMSCLNI